MCFLRTNLSHLCLNMIYVDALDVSECLSEEVVSFFWCSVYYIAFAAPQIPAWDITATWHVAWPRQSHVKQPRHINACNFKNCVSIWYKLFKLGRTLCSFWIPCIERLKPLVTRNCFAKCLHSNAVLPMAPCIIKGLNIKRCSCYSASHSLTCFSVLFSFFLSLSLSRLPRNIARHADGCLTQITPIHPRAMDASLQLATLLWLLATYLTSLCDQALAGNVWTLCIS